MDPAVVNAGRGKQEIAYILYQPPRVRNTSSSNTTTSLHSTQLHTACFHSHSPHTSRPLVAGSLFGLQANRENFYRLETCDQLEMGVVKTGSCNSAKFFRLVWLNLLCVWLHCAGW